ncbi:hypothetical protein L228DRAFT_127886 [Xylona heveae TC161]|uniref:Zn(2)-C6 fungal-type domain-containing protein n=1 Tax=Xylona heveae (strain CBS 132557 / TC161) TaxID=1328760 RepID=A0A165GRX4_XYLHT|nr:hypothetical protein L228DRAFT_127886 [Xylona heveae TC161]KZF22518.1 hypothetical protein L228DRAFT_127886 [Xylona heveae TC161]
MALSQDIDNMASNFEDGSASPSPDISGDQHEATDMAEHKANRSDSGDTGSVAGSGTGQRPNPSSNAKDPLRPRRKKARRACFACQRAHLTCGDERPCQRCIKRGLQDACHDGVRKKAKYLHDAPPEALMPGLASQYNQMSAAMANRGSLTPTNPSGPDVSTQMGPPGGFYPQPQAAAASPAYSIYSQNAAPPQGTMQPPMQDNLIQRPTSYPNQQSPLGSGFPNPNSQQPTPMQNMPGAMPPTSIGNQPQNGTAFGGGGPLFDPSDPALFNFDLASLNFGNHYGALEFGMLGHMSSGAAETPPADNTGNGPMGANPVSGPDFATPSSGYGGSPSTATPFIFGQDPSTGEWNGVGGNVSRQGSGGGPYGNGHGNLETSHRPTGPLAYAIGAGPSSLASASPAESPQAAYTGYERPSMSPAYFANTGGQPPAPLPPPPPPPPSQVSVYNRAVQQGEQQHQQQQQQEQQQQQQQQQPQPLKPHPVQQLSHPHPHQHHHNTKVPGYQMQHVLGKRRRDPSAIYDSVKQPYSYTNGFHGLTAFLQKRFPPQKTLRIAKALASIRPSFISCSKTLNREDFIFMEKCFQRTLFQYEDFINACGTPTIVCRRTGEVAAVGKEFSILTGWKKDVLLGQEPNLNVNTGSGDANSPLAVSRSGGGGGGGGAATAAQRQEGSTSGQAQAQGQVQPDGRPKSPGQPVFLAELLDDDSVIQFYEDFARIAFGDSRGSVMTRCKLLKYKTREDMTGGGGGGAAGKDGFDGSAGGGGGGSGETAGSEAPGEDGKRIQHHQHHQRKRGSLKHAPGFKSDISTEADMNQLGSRDGKVECTYCWTVKRDVFDIPMLIVMNFLPCI